MPLWKLSLAIALAGSCLFTTACTHKVEGGEPIVINLNVKIDHEMKIKVEKEVEALFEDDNGLF